MLNRQPGTKKAFEITGALCGWFAVVSQFILLIRLMPASPAETVIRFFSFFTIEVNILVACCFSLLAFGPQTAPGRFFSTPQRLTALTVYILIVGLVYNLVLRSLWNPAGLQRLTDEFLHTVIPLYFLLYWIYFVPKNKLRWKQALPWLIYPLIYLVYTLTRGAITGHYPYPFIDAKQLGYPKALTNAGWLSLLFLLFSLLIIGLGKGLNTRKE